MKTFQRDLFEQPVQPDREMIKAGILEILKHEPPMKARQIAYRLSRKFQTTVTRFEINHLIYGELRRIVKKPINPDYLVVLATEGTAIPPKPRAKRLPMTRPEVVPKPIPSPIISTRIAIRDGQRLFKRAIGFGYAFLAFELIKFVLTLH